MNSTGIPPEADLKSYVTYHVLLMLREGLRCYLVEENKKSLYVIGLAGAYELARKVVKTGGEFGAFRDGVVEAVSRKVFETFSRLFAGTRLSYCLRTIEEAARTLVDIIFSYGSRPLVHEENTKCMNSVAEVVEKLDYFEERYYEELKSGYVRVAREILAKFADAKLIASLNEIVRASLRARYSWITRVGSRKVLYDDLPGDVSLSLQNMLDLALVFKEEYGRNFIIPAPLLEGSLAGAFAEPESKTAAIVREVPTPVSLKPVRCHEISESSLPPSREVLEGIVAKVLQSLGYSAKVDAKLPNRSGGETEVDVWGVKGQFKIYVSCKNWDRDVGKSVVEEEFGRVLNLRDIPHLKVLVAKSLTDEARRTAVTDGFYVVELGVKAEAKNSAETCEVLADRLAEIFVSIAPLQLAEAYRKVEDMGRLVVDLAKRIEELKRALGVT